MAGRNSEVRVAIVADNSDLSRGLKDSQSKLAGFGRAVGKIALAAGAAAAVGLAAIGKASVDAASDAQQSLGGTQAVFGKFADQVIKDSNRAARAVGLSANQYRESANIIGALLVNQGLAQDKLRGQTKGLITTASDLAATFGGTTANAVDALASALKGEFDPLQNLGITLLQSKVNTEALSVANVKSVAAFNKLSTAQQTSAKRQATLNLIAKQSKVAQGQFAKQTKTLAEQQQILGAQWDNLKVKIGNALLPAVTHLFQVLNADLMPALSKLAKQYLPEVRKALDGWVRGGDPSKMMANLGDSLHSIDWTKAGQGLADIGSSLKTLLPLLAQVSVNTAGDALTVLGIGLKFAADHADTLAKILPVLVIAFAAYKTAQLANNVLGKDSVIGLVLQIAQTRQLTIANRELAASLTQLNGTMGGTTAAAAKTSGGIKGLGMAAKAAAGIGGLLALQAGAKETDKGLSTLETTAGGAALGWSLGGPWGAAIGAGAGLLFGLSKKTDTVTQSLDAMAEAARGGRGAQLNLRTALDQTTGAMTEQARQLVSQDLFNQRLGKSAADLGIPLRDVVSAVLGQEGAFKRVQAAVDRWKNAGGAAATNVQNRMSDAAINIGAYLGGASAKFRRTGEEIRQVARGTESWGKALKGLPKGIKVELRNQNYRVTVAEVRNLAKQYRLNPKKLETRLTLAGVDVVKKQARDTKKALQETGKVKPDLGPYRQSLDSQMARFSRDAETGARQVSNRIKSETGKARADLGPFSRGLNQSLSAAKGTASSGGAGVGASLRTGVMSGISGLGAQLSAQLSADVRAGIAAARAAARAQSPSKETEQLGKDLTRGLILGVQRGSSGVASALTKLTDRTASILAHQLKDQQRAIEQHYAAMRAAAKHQLKGKPEDKRLAMLSREQAKALRDLDKAWAKHSKAVAKGTADERKALVALGKAQDKVAAQLEKARGKLADLTQTSKDYAASIRDSFVAFGDITQLGKNEDTGGVDIGDLVAQLKTRMVQAQRFAALVKRLQKEGLSRDQIEQLTAAGVDGGLATAEAIQSAIDSGQVGIIKTLNQTTAAIKEAGGSLGDSLATDYFQAGIKAAQGLVKGLESQADKLDRASARLAKALVRAIKKALGIKSPSTVFRDIGTQINQGLAIGIGDTYATRASADLASSVVGAFGSPGLSAAASSGSNHLTATVTLTAAQVQQLERGRQIQLDLDAYQAAGGRRRA